MNCQTCNRSFTSNWTAANHKCVSNEVIEKVKKLYDEGLSLREIRHLGYARFVTRLAIKKGSRRNPSEASILGKKKHPFRHTEESKRKLSVSASKWLKTRINHPWRKKQESFPEKLMREWLEKNSEYQIIQEYTPADFDKNYRMDFAVADLKVDIEVNGNAHYQDRQNRQLKPYYVEREAYIVAKGWKVINVFAGDVCNNFDEVASSLRTLLDNNDANSNSVNSIVVQSQDQAIIDALTTNFDTIQSMISEGSSTVDICKKFNVKSRQLRAFLKTKGIKRFTPQIYKAKQKTKKAIADLKNHDLDEWGITSKLALKWGTNRTTMCRLIRQFRRETIGN